MIVEEVSVGVEVERRLGATRWQRFVWCPVAIVPERDLAAWTALAEDGEAAHFFAGNATIVLRSTDTKVLKDNADGPTPSIYVVLRRARSLSGWSLHLVTADPSEAHAHADVGNDLVEAVPMPPPILCRTLAFLARHHVDRTEWSRRRDSPDAEALARRPVVEGIRNA
jgi:hypothetical protein